MTAVRHISYEQFVNFTFILSKTVDGVNNLLFFVYIIIDNIL